MAISSMAYVEENVGTLKQQLAKLFEKSLRVTVSEEMEVEPLIVACNPRFGDYQCHSAMSLWIRIKAKGTEFIGPRLVGQALKNNLPASDMVELCSIAGPGFLNIVLSKQWMAKSIHKMLMDGIGSWAPHLPVKRAVVDFSSPNIAKEMHVGHLRSTTVGDTLVRMLEFSGVEVLRRNCVGDWDTQVGMLIGKLPDLEVANDQAIVDLEGESFYSPYFAMVLELLNEKGLIKESEGARVIFIEGNKPLTVVKRDGGYNYALTYLTALWYRLNEEKVEWIIYVTDVDQCDHFGMVFAAAKRAGWLSTNNKMYPRADHVGFGLVLGEDGKRFRTRSTQVVQLADLLDEAKTRCRDALVERGEDNEWTEEELEQTAEAVGYGAVKYADLKNNRSTNCTFNFDQMLKGNTAVYLLDAHARICSIIKMSGKDIEELKKVGKIELTRDAERVLGLHLLQFAETVEDACTNLMPNTLCEYIYRVSEDFTRFYSTCKVVGSPEETSRLLLCEATAVVMRKCFHLFGITPVYKI